MSPMSTTGAPAATERVAGRLVLDDVVLPGTLVVAEGRIASVEPDPAAAGGPLVCPGFVDVHVHGFGGHDAMGGQAALDGMARALVRRGVTSFLPSAVTAPLETLGEFADAVRAWLPHAPADGSGPLGFNLEGPFLNPIRRGAQNANFMVVPARVPAAMLESLLEAFRLTTIAPELEGALELIHWLADRRVVVSLGHSDATFDQARAGYAAGATSTTHLFNAMSGVDHHAPGLAVAALVSDSAWVELIADGHHVDASLWPLILHAKPADRLLLVSDAVALAGLGDGRMTLGGLDVDVRDGQARLASDGRLAGSVIALDDAVRNLVRSGVDLPRAVATASRNPLWLLGIHDRGRLEPGQLADLVLLDDALGIVRVMRAGAWVT